MKFKNLIFFILLFGCVPNVTKFENREPLNSKGFAYIFEENKIDEKVFKGKLDNTEIQVSHNTLKPNSLVKIINLKTKDSITLNTTNKINYPEFYKILITQPVADKIKLDSKLPLVEVLELKKNKSFIAKKAKIFTEEKKISNKAPVASVQISNISKEKRRKKNLNQEKIFILIGSFYSIDTVKFLKERINEEITNYDSKKMKIVRRNNKQIDLISGPYNTINLMKNDYILLKKFGFEELDIILNE